MTNEEQIHYLNFLVKEYEGFTRFVAQTKQRLQSLPGEAREESFDTLLKGQEKQSGLETIKGRMTRGIEKELREFDIWERWAKNIPGIGPFITAQMIILFYYRFIPVCKDCGGRLLKEESTEKDDEEKIAKKKKTLICEQCGKRAEKDGLLNYRLEYKDFPTISKWWAYMGRHTVDGAMPKRKKGTLSNWSTVGRTLGFHIGDQFNRQKDDHPYKALLKLRKEKHQRDNPKWSKGHIHNAARNETVKIFLAHWWTVARTLEGKQISEPYAGALMGHTNIIKPYYWEGSDSPNEMQPRNASHPSNKTEWERASTPNIEVRV